MAMQSRAISGFSGVITIKSLLSLLSGSTFTARLLGLSAPWNYKSSAKFIIIAALFSLILAVRIALVLGLRGFCPISWREGPEFRNLMQTSLIGADGHPASRLHANRMDTSATASALHNARSRTEEGKKFQ
ncbi:hypothetical protein DFH06DRAFT_1122727 [Mycena polygramma]|nr:hypothetical protein DFH06DRAFT_1122727 [Mycena polygramma]